jgi:hypothetical protein
MGWGIKKTYSFEVTHLENVVRDQSQNITGDLFQTGKL